MAEISESDFDELDEAYGKEEKAGGRPPREERIITGFEEIQRFVAQHKRAPRDLEGADIFERLYAVRLESLRRQPDCRALLEPMDADGLLGTPVDVNEAPVDLSELDALAEEDSVTTLKHVRSSEEKRAAEDIAQRKRVDDFTPFKHMFEQVQKALTTGARTTRRYGGTLKEIAVGRFYILNGQKAYVDAMGVPFENDQGKQDARLRVVFDNGTESNLLMRSFQKALQQDVTGRSFDDPDLGPLFGEEQRESGTIYVLRTKSERPEFAKHRDVLHKIGVTGGSVQTRIANAKLEPTYLLADVEIVAEYTLYDIHRTRLENLLHRLFASARLNIEIQDRFGNPVRPEEWFLVPLPVINEAVARVQDGTIVDYVYDAPHARLVAAPR